MGRRGPLVDINSVFLEEKIQKKGGSSLYGRSCLKVTRKLFSTRKSTKIIIITFNTISFKVYSVLK